MNGILVVDKPSGITSREVVDIVSRCLNVKKVGHTGTLDPLATGVLVLAVGSATKIVELLTSNDKEYIATVKLGLLTDTLDIEGKIIKQESFAKEKLENLPLVLESFVKTYQQEVPLFSAVKVNGKRLYQYARNNETVCLPKKMITVYDINLLNKVVNDTFSFKCLVSKGTYIRSLIRDIGDELGIPCVMMALRRTRQGIFIEDMAFTIEDIKKGHYKLLSIMDALRDFPKVVVSNQDKKKIENGMILPKIFTGKYALICDQNDNLLAIYQEYVKDDNLMKPFKIFVKND